MKQDYSVKDILNAVDDILTTKISEKQIQNETKDILNAVDGILKLQNIEYPSKKIIDQKSIKINDNKKIFENFVPKKENLNKLETKNENLNKKENKKKYDLLVINNAKDVLILNRIIFK